MSPHSPARLVFLKIFRSGNVPKLLKFLPNSLNVTSISNQVQIKTWGLKPLLLRRITKYRVKQEFWSSVGQSSKIYSL